MAICWELLRGHWTAFSRRRHSRRSLIALGRLAAEQAVFVVELDPGAKADRVYGASASFNCSCCCSGCNRNFTRACSSIR